MCGIVGYIGNQNASPILLEGLKKLEYRGYDSSGIAVLNENGLELRRRVGKLAALEGSLRSDPLKGTLGLGHTRWATHGVPNEENAHPHTCCAQRIAVVHNGIVENYSELKARLSANGHVFKSMTDTEVLAHLIEDAFKKDLMQAVADALRQVKGSYALGVISHDDHDRIIVARKDSPLVVGLGDNESFIASDVPALLHRTQRVIFLKDGEIAEMSQKGASLWDEKGKSIVSQSQVIQWDAAAAEKTGYKHYMLKEIFEQPKTVQQTLTRHYDSARRITKLEEVLPLESARALKKVTIVGCGTSYHAGLVGKYWIEELSGVPCEVDLASEYRYRRIVREPGALVVLITQSGETADTLAALRDAKAKGFETLTICNAVGASATREADHTLYTLCGPEIGVASTKAFTGQLTALLMLAVYLAQSRGKMSEEALNPLLDALKELPVLMQSVLNKAEAVKRVASKLYTQKSFIFLGRHVNYPIALEGALKLKEISYIHAEGYAAGEMKHGPIALIERGVPVVTIAPQSFVHDKMLSNIEEVRARSGHVVAVGTAGDKDLELKAHEMLTIPTIHELLSPFLTVLPLQMLAYHIARLRGCDVDQPRNLAKSVTVE